MLIKVQCFKKENYTKENNFFVVRAPEIFHQLFETIYNTVSFRQFIGKPKTNILRAYNTVSGKLASHPWVRFIYFQKERLYCGELAELHASDLRICPRRTLQILLCLPTLQKSITWISFASNERLNFSKTIFQLPLIFIRKLLNTN